MTDHDRIPPQQLAPCPFCGGEAGYYASGEAVFKVNWVGHVCRCKHCQARVSTTAGMDAAIAMWNARALTALTFTSAAEIPSSYRQCEHTDCERIAGTILNQKHLCWDHYLEAQKATAPKPAGCEPCTWPECGCQKSPAARTLTRVDDHMTRARRLVEDHISAYGMVPHPDRIKEAIAEQSQQSFDLGFRAAGGIAPDVSSPAGAELEEIEREISDIIYKDASISHFDDDSEVDNASYLAHLILRKYDVRRRP